MLHYSTMICVVIGRNIFQYKWGGGEHITFSLAKLISLPVASVEIKCSCYCFKYFNSTFSQTLWLHWKLRVYRLRLWSTQFRLRSSKFRLRSSKFRLRSSKFRIWSTQFKLWCTEYSQLWLWSTELWIWHSEFRLQRPEQQQQLRGWRRWRRNSK